MSGGAVSSRTSFRAALLLAFATAALLVAAPLGVRPPAGLRQPRRLPADRHHAAPTTLTVTVARRSARRHAATGIYCPSDCTAGLPVDRDVLTTRARRARPMRELDALDVVL